MKQLRHENVGGEVNVMDGNRMHFALEHFISSSVTRCDVGRSTSRDFSGRAMEEDGLPFSGSLRWRLKGVMLWMI